MFFVPGVDPVIAERIVCISHVSVCVVLVAIGDPGRVGWIAGIAVGIDHRERVALTVIREGCHAAIWLSHAKQIGPR